MTRPFTGAGYRMLGAVAPGVAGRRATDAFSHTRALGVYPDDVPPLGARTFDVAGDPFVRRGYVWGDDGPAALLVHGWGSDSSSMHGLVRPLRSLGYRVHAFDAPGHGVNEGSQATMAQFAAAVGAVLDTIGGAQVVVAHSIGSIASVSALAARPHLQPDCMTLVAPTWTIAGVLERWADGKLPGGVVDRVRHELTRRNGVPAEYWDLVALGRGLSCPVLVVHDPGDAVVPFGDGQAVAAGLPHAELEALPGGGHMGILMSAELRSVVAAFVAGQTRTGEPIR